VTRSSRRRLPPPPTFSSSQHFSSFRFWKYDFFLIKKERGVFLFVKKRVVNNFPRKKKMWFVREKRQNYVNCLVFFLNLGEYREDGHLEIIRRHVFTLSGPWLIQGTGRKILGWMAHSSRDLFLTESFPVLFSLFCISCQLRVFYFSFLMVRYIYPHFGCPSNIWWGFKLCQDTRLFC
jgi:hypothetical protein